MNLQEAEGRTVTIRPTAARGCAPRPRAGGRLLHFFLGRLIQAFGSDAVHIPADVHRAFHRGASLALTERGPAPKRWRVIWTS